MGAVMTVTVVLRGECGYMYQSISSSRLARSITQHKEEDRVSKEGAPDVRSPLKYAITLYLSGEVSVWTAV